LGRDISVLDTLENVSRAAADRITGHVRAVLSERSYFSLVLSGGSTPRGLYRLLAEDDALRASVPWEAVHIFWGDERHVPPDHPLSNYRMAAESLLTRVPIPAANIHRIRCEVSDARTTAHEYEQELTAFFGSDRDRFPRFDCILLGMGTDGHTASLFPNSGALRERHRLVTADRPEGLKNWRVSLTLPVLNHAGLAMFLVSGADKAHTLSRVLEGDRTADSLPARLVCPVHGKLVWLIDRAAAGELSFSGTSRHGS